MTSPNPAVQDTATTTTDATNTNGATVAKPASSGTNGSQSLLPTEMPDLNDDAAWDAMPSWARKLRNENARRRVENKDKDDALAEAQTKLTALETANLSDDQKELVRLRKLEQEQLPLLQQERRKLEVQLRADELGVVDSEAVVALLDWKRIDKGDKIDDVIKQLIEDKPYLKKQPVEETATTTLENDESKSSTNGTTNKKDDATQDGANLTAQKTSVAAPGNTHRATTYTKSQIQRMSTDEINDAYENGGLRDAMANGRVKNE